MVQNSLEIRKLEAHQGAEFIRLVEIFKAVFENGEPMPEKGYLTQLLANPDFQVFVVCFEGKIVGGLSLYVLHGYYASKPTAYLYDVAIDTAFQGRGFGKALMAHVCDHCQKQGFLEAYVEAESEDVEALQFYRKTSFSTEMNAVHFTYEF